MLSIIVASHFMLAYPADVLPNSEISNVHFFRKKTEITNGNCKRTPAVPVSSLHADVTNNRIILNFEDEEFSDIDVTVAYGDTVIYYNHYTRKGSSTLSIPFAMLGNNLPYSITINSKGKIYEAHFSL